MSDWPLRFVHAGDFGLESPPRGVAEVPSHLRELFAEAAYWAAERVFETVLAEEAEFLVLSGGILDPAQAGPRGPLFLCEQFERLAERGIPVYWAGGKTDAPQSWPRAVLLPENVHRFASEAPDEVVFERNGLPAVRLVGQSHGRRNGPRPGGFRGDPSGLPTVGVVHGTFGAEELADADVHYWALGGRHERATPATSPSTVHYPGTPQGRSPGETGAHGCSLVELDEDSCARTSLVPTDVMRWVAERVVIDAETSREGLVTRLSERLQSLVDGAAGADLLVTWTIAGSGPLLGRLRRRHLADELLAALREKFGNRSPAAWSLSLEIESRTRLPDSAYEEETIRGDFLRAVEQLQLNPDEPLELTPYLGERNLRGPFHALARIDDTNARERLLHQAAQLGADLLSGNDDG